MDSRDALEAALMTVPIPGSPPRMSPDEAPVGLAFLDMALRQNHIRRITERLLLQQHLAPRCVAEIDISLNLLHQEQRDACEAFQQARQRNVVSGIESRPHPDGESISAAAKLEQPTVPEDIIWIPVARLPRQAVAPIDVRDSTGARLPRLTQLEVAMPLASGLYQLLRGMLGSSPDARIVGDLGKLLYRVDNSRWLLQAALLALFVSRTSPSEAMSRAPSPGTLPGHGYKYREFLRKVLAKYDLLLKPFYNLLDVALNDYLLIVGLPQPREHHLLSYEVPLIAEPGRRPLLDAQGFRRRVRGFYQVRYETHVPSSLRSYHLVAETDPTLQIDSMHITSDADDRQSLQVESDLRFLAKRTARNGQTDKNRATGKIVELELRAVIGELSQLVTRRRWEADEARLDWTPERLPATDKLTWASLSGEIPDGDERRSTSLLNHPSVSSKRLAAAADEVRQNQLGHDYFKGNEPPSNQAHVYWRRYAHAQSSARRIVVRSGIAISNATQTGMRVVMLYVLAVLVVSYLMGSLLARDPFPFAQSSEFVLDGRSDAIVAVLLLVPGFLYSRLDLPPRGSVAARVRIGLRWTAHATMAVTALQATVVAAASSSRVVGFAFSIGCVLLLGILAFLWLFGLRSHDQGLGMTDVPRWVTGGEERGSRRGHVEVSLFASGVKQTGAKHE